MSRPNITDPQTCSVRAERRNSYVLASKNVKFQSNKYHLYHACMLNWGIQVKNDHLQHEFFLFVKASLRVLYIRYSPAITYYCIQVSTLQGWFSPSGPKINLFAFTFCLLMSCSGVKIVKFQSNKYHFKLKSQSTLTNAESVEWFSIVCHQSR